MSGTGRANQVKRSRVSIFVSGVIVVASGLCIVASTSRLPAWVRGHVGDVLVCIAIYLAVAFLFPRARAWRIALFTIVYSVIVECTQLYHAPGLDRFRSTLAGQLTIGSTFSWSDMVCYAMGTLIALSFDFCFLLRFHRLQREVRH